MEIRFYKKENGSVAIDLSSEGLDEKILLRGDGTSVYMTQDLGTAIDRFKEFKNLSQLIYTVGNEQDYHFKVLFKTLEMLETLTCYRAEKMRERDHLIKSINTTIASK